MPSHSHRTGKDLAYDFFCKLYNNNNFNFHIDPAIENARFFLRGGGSIIMSNSQLTSSLDVDSNVDNVIFLEAAKSVKYF